MIRLSVVVPAYNEDACLLLCLQSLAKQQCTEPFEVIVVTTSEEDTSNPIVRNFASQAPFPLSLVIETRRGICFARQAGCDAASGEIIVSTDADIQQPPLWLEHIWQAFQANNSLVGVSGAFIFTKKPRWAYHTFNGLFRLTKWFNILFGWPLYVAAMNLAFKRDALKNIGGYNTALNQAGDEYDILRRLRKVGTVRYLAHNPVHASNRRFQRNVMYSFFVTFLYYYVLEYWIARITGRSIIGAAPAIRESVN